MDEKPIRTYHVVYYEQREDIYSKGVNVKAKSIAQAIFIFETKYKVEPFLITLKD